MPYAPDQMATLHFPKAGIDVSRAYAKQSARPGPNGEPAVYTTPVGVNVRGFEPLTQRFRGGTRPGLVKYVAAVVQSDFIVQEITTLTGTGYDDPSGGDVQPSQSGRVVTLIAVSKGNLYVASPGDDTWTAATNSVSHSPPLNVSGVMQSAPNNQKMYFADGANKAFYNPATNIIDDWTLTDGTFPADGDGNLPRLICLWRGRTVQSGLIGDPQNWFMSRVGDAHDYDYGAAVENDPSIAVAGNNSELGLIGDVITALIPYTDDILIFGGDHTIYMMRGDPAAGGSIDRISDAIGMAWGMAWCKDPLGNVYFFSNLCGVFTFVPGQSQPVRISQGIDPLLREVDTGENIIRLIWDDRFQGFHLFITLTDEAAATTHYFYEARTGAWWQDKFTNKKHNPLCCCTLDGNEPGDRVPLIGSWDGYVRAITPDAVDDDGYAIASEVLLGPLLTPNLDDVEVKDAQAVLGETSGNLNYEILYGDTAEEALDPETEMEQEVTGTWSAGRNYTHLIEVEAHALYFRLFSTVTWAIESIRLTMGGVVSKIRRRGA